MNKIIALTLVSGLLAAPVTMAAGTFEDAGRALDAGTAYGITHFRSLEVDDDGRMELEGWVDSDWYVELDLKNDATVDREQRRKQEGTPWGVSADEINGYLEAARCQGMERFDELKVNAKGYIEVEGEDKDGRELELDFRAGDRTPVTIERDDRE